MDTFLVLNIQWGAFFLNANYNDWDQTAKIGRLVYHLLLVNKKTDFPAAHLKIPKVDY